MATKLKERASFFSTGEQKMIMNHYEEYKTIIMAKSNTATAVRARQEEVCEDDYGVISMYEYMMASVIWYRGQAISVGPRLIRAQTMSLIRTRLQLSG